jgi:hypothetical protein
MRIFTMVVAVLALIAMPAHAQFKKGGGQTEDSNSKSDIKQKKENDKAYKAALERIPDSKEKYDPWSVARPADSAKKPK